MAHEIADRLLSALGIDDPAGLLDLPVDAIVAAQAQVIDRDIGRRNGGGGRSWGVVHDGVVLPDLPENSIAAGAAAGIPLLLGSTEDEVRLFRWVDPTFAPQDLAALAREVAERVGADGAEGLVADYAAMLGTDDPGAVRERLLTDAIYRLPSTGMADVAAGAGGTVFVYRWACPHDERLGAFHSSDVRFLFDNVHLPDLFFPRDPEPELEALGHEMSGWLARFVRTGDPGWPAWTVPDRIALRADRSSRTVRDPDGEARRIWERARSASAGQDRRP